MLCLLCFWILTQQIPHCLPKVQTKDLYFCVFSGSATQPGKSSAAALEEVLCSVLAGGDPVGVFEGPGKMKLVFITHGTGHLPHGDAAALQELRCLRHAVLNQILLGRKAHGLLEELAKIAAVQTAGCGDLLHGHVSLVVLVDEAHGLLDIEIPQPFVAGFDPCLAALNDFIQQNHPQADLSDWGFFMVIQQKCHKPLDRVAARLGRIDGLGLAEARQGHALSGAHAVKLNPCIGPGVVLVGIIGTDLPRAEEKALARFEKEGLAAGLKLPRPADDVVKQKVISHCRAELVQRVTALPAELIQIQIHEAFILEHVKSDLALGLNRRLLFHLSPSPKASRYRYPQHIPKCVMKSTKNGDFLKKEIKNPSFIHSKSLSQMLR